MEAFSFTPVAIAHTCYKAKFGIPRQSGLVNEATGVIEFLPPYNQPNAVRGLEDFSHIWVLFVFHQSIRESWKATVRPPRLGGDRRVGVFASRSPFRPCPIGLSAVKLDEVVCKNAKVLLRVRGMDILDGTPVLDVKPYIPYADSLPDASGGFAPSAPATEALAVSFTDEALAQCATIEKRGITDFTVLARKLISANPRPAYQNEDGRVYGIFVHGYEVVWKIDGDSAVITEIRKIGGNHGSETEI
ncbi:MAG: tRNA (N6-threonylcarbamoyladenosine(37)-N6)-methyltransferase TrmO [Victivallales bacterium]|nr:tRNA (N6-threonylcarbamoyladenosine(37)-N6)-methyltransferase TrmO [Victivallales bacterium]